MRPPLVSKLRAVDIVAKHARGELSKEQEQSLRELVAAALHFADSNAGAAEWLSTAAHEFMVATRASNPKPEGA